MKTTNTALIKLWENRVGAVTWVDKSSCAVFEYDPSFLKLGLDISPLHMGIKEAVFGQRQFHFPTINPETFHGLPGMLADALPDKFGNSIIDTWLARQGRSSKSFTPIERLCYTGKRGMGALEFEPLIVNKDFNSSQAIDIAHLVELAGQIMGDHTSLQTSLDSSEKNNSEALIEILRVGTSAGGARPKAIIAMNQDNNILSGQISAPKGYDYWLLKFDGVTDLELGAPRGYGRIEYAYHLMAKASGIQMTECRLLEEHGRAHFMTKRFDRIDGKKIHLQSLCGLAHYDFNRAGAYSYEQAFEVMRTLQLSKAEISEQYRRMVFNVIARNLDDHTKNISFLMDSNGQWSLSPSYDVTYSHNPHGIWTNMHQMSLNGKRDHFTRDDLLQVGSACSISNPHSIINDVESAVKEWEFFAKQSKVHNQAMDEIKKHHITNI